MENKYYIYLHIKLTDGSPFYVGKGSGKRAFNKHARSSFWNNMANKYGYDVIMLEGGLTEQNAYSKEIYWIDRIGRKDLGKGPLVNHTDGGDNPPSKLGKKLSEETKAKMSLAAMGNTKGLGRKHTDETKLKLRESHLGEKNSQYGIIHTDEYKEKMRIKSTGKKHTDETKLKVSLSKKGKPLSEEHKAALRKPKTKKH